MASSGSGDATSSLWIEQGNRHKEISNKIYTYLRSYESVILYLQRVLVWEKPMHSISFFVLMHIGFGYVTIRSNHLIGFISSITLVFVILDVWKHKLWPEIRAVAPDEEAEWGELHPRLLSLQEMCQILCEVFLWVEWAFNQIRITRQTHPGKFCAVFCACCIALSIVGQKIPGVILSYAMMICLLLWPLVWYYRILEKSYTKIEPFFMQMQYTLRQRSTTTQYLTKYVRTKKLSEPASEESDDDISDFLPQLDEKTAEVLARAITDDSELSETDEEILAQELPTFSRASTPDNLTASETYLTTLPQQFPNINDDNNSDDDFGLPVPDYNENVQRDRSTVNQPNPAQFVSSEIVTAAIGNVIKDTFSSLVHRMKPEDNEETPTGQSKSSTPSSDFEFLELDNDSGSK
uniref:Protein FAM134C-like n=1 Tax=Phallusia mammillata TaxID=59560 RepID=A0A6F9DD76_9ASCI|nr:protein FAM134C-like [Phallusia mammillata]